MRKKVNEDVKRNILIGIKTDKNTKKKIDYIAAAAGEPTSTYLYNLITEHIDQYTKMTKIKWGEELDLE